MRPVIAHYEREARRCGVGAIIEDLVHLVARLALAEALAPTDALHYAEALGDAAETITTDGQVTGLLPEPDADARCSRGTRSALVVPETLVCAGCGASSRGDDDSDDLPVCPACGTRDTWEERQYPAFRALVAEIDACSALAELGAIGKRLYVARLPHDQAGVAWTHYRFHRAALEAAITLGPEARRLLAAIERASERELPRVGANLYRVQRVETTAIGTAEWRRLWAVYGACRRRRAA